MKEIRQIKLALIDSDFMDNRIKSILNDLDKTFGNLNKYTYTYKTGYISILYGKNETDIIMEKSHNKIYLLSSIYNNFSEKYNLIEPDNIFEWYLKRIYKNEIDTILVIDYTTALKVLNFNKIIPIDFEQVK